MGLPRLKDDEMSYGNAVNDEVTRRINSARLHDLSYRIKTIAPDLSDDDAESLARVILEADAEGQPRPSGDEIRQRLRGHGRSPHAAERITKSVGL